MLVYNGLPILLLLHQLFLEAVDDVVVNVWRKRKDEIIKNNTPLTPFIFLRPHMIQYIPINVKQTYRV